MVMKMRHDFAWPVAYTVNGVQVVPGLWVLDADEQETVVLARCPYVDGDNTPWFYTDNGGMFDGSRLEALSRADGEQVRQRLRDAAEAA